MMKVIKQDTNKWRNRHCFWIERNIKKDIKH